MNVCADCFANIHLRRYVLAVSRHRASCSICSNRNARVIDASKLYDVIQPVLELYARNANGRNLCEIIQRDWTIFSSSKRKKQIALLNAITGDKRFTKNKYRPVLPFDHDSIKKWNRFREELKHVNRFFPKNVPDKDHLARLSEYLGYPKKEIPKVFFRARTNIDNKPYSILQMGKPPARIVSNGRANPIGIPYLYLASDVRTAIAEIKPHKGESVTVASYKAVGNLEIIDLRKPDETINPFELNDETDLRLIYQNRQYLTLLGEELSKPIIPREADLEYLPSQFLCELFKAIGTHGIAYKSSIAPGDNFVIFNDKHLKIVKTSVYVVTNTSIGFRKSNELKSK